MSLPDSVVGWCEFQRSIFTCNPVCKRDPGRPHKRQKDQF